MLRKKIMAFIWLNIYIQTLYRAIIHVIVIAGNGQSVCLMKAVLVGHSSKSVKLDIPIQTGIFGTAYVCLTHQYIHCCVTGVSEMLLHTNYLPVHIANSLLPSLSGGSLNLPTGTPLWKKLRWRSCDPPYFDYVKSTDITGYPRLK